MSPKSEGRSNNVTDAVFPTDFRDFIHELNAHAVEYLLVGGYAVGMYGHVRATTDIDFLYRRTPENVTRLMRALVAFGAPEIVIDRQLLASPQAVTQFGAPPLRIDLLSDISGVSFDHAQSGAVHVEVAGEPLPVIGLDALRTNKHASGRKKDRDDLKHLPTTMPARDTQNSSAKPKKAAKAKKNPAERAPDSGRRRQR